MNEFCENDTTIPDKDQFGGFVNNITLETQKGVIAYDYRSFYPEPFEWVIEKYKVNYFVLEKYYDKYEVVKKVIDTKMSEGEFCMYRSEFVDAVIEIVKLEKR